MTEQKPVAAWRYELVRVLMATAAAAAVHYTDTLQYRGPAFFLSAWLAWYGIFFLLGRLDEAVAQRRWKRVLSVVLIAVVLSSAGFGMKAFLSSRDAAYSPSEAHL